MSKALDLIGQKFGRLTVIKRIGSNSHGQSIWLCKCDCGNEKVIRGYCLSNGHTQSCGCYNMELKKERSNLLIKNNTKHGMRNNILYDVWYAMVDRCTNPNSPPYKNYGGRGILVCDEWKDNPTCFIEWATSHGYKSGLQIDRINNELGYSPNNCRFVDRKTNCRNKRNNIKFGKWKSFLEVGETIGVIRDKKSYERLKYFIKSHGTLSESLSHIGGI